MTGRIKYPNKTPATSMLREQRLNRATNTPLLLDDRLRFSKYVFLLIRAIPTILTALLSKIASLYDFLIWIKECLFCYYWISERRTTLNATFSEKGKAATENREQNTKKLRMNYPLLVGRHSKLKTVDRWSHNCKFSINLIQNMLILLLQSK